MRICVIALGSRGDVQPFAALARGLRAAGHHVRIAASPAFESFVSEVACEFAPVGGDVHAFAQTRLARTLLERRRLSLSSWRLLGRALAPTVHQRLLDCWHACEDADAILVSPMAVLAGYSIAEKLHVPLIRVFWAPLRLPERDVLARLRTLAGRMTAPLVWSFFRSVTNRARRDVLGLPPLAAIRPLAQLDRGQSPVLCAYSGQASPPPADLPDWIHVTGFWVHHEGTAWQPPTGLTDFLAAGPPPVYVGFGSMTHPSPTAATQLVVQALDRSGQRGILATGWGALNRTAVSRQVYCVDDVPHDWLFSRVSAAVHHGGAGSIAASLRAGLPTVVVPFGIPDQPFWGQRVYELGAGPRPIPRRHLSVKGLAEAIRIATTDRSIRDRAEDLGRRIRAEDGVGRAVDVLQRVLATSRPGFGGRPAPNSIQVPPAVGGSITA